MARLGLLARALAAPVFSAFARRHGQEVARSRWWYGTKPAWHCVENDMVRHGRTGMMRWLTSTTPRWMCEKRGGDRDDDDDDGYDEYGTDSDDPSGGRGPSSIVQAAWAQTIGQGVDSIEADIEEKFVRGSGKGGQAVNKSNNCVQLKHRPTGLQVRCHETRSLDQNRKIARRIMWEKLEHMVKGAHSKIGQEISKVRSQKRKRKKRVDKNKHYKSLRDRKFWEG